MSVSIQNVSKIYGVQHALDDVSFVVNANEVVGFLGPNGAGKSTLMKIITCFIPPSSGTVKVCGFDVNDEEMEVKKRVGYLPEHNPLYLEMYVKEYLQFIAGLHKLSSPKQKVSEMIERVGLTLEQNKKIGYLSKGYRQRVGIAQALIHDPQVLILDEPTSGLDPNQLEDIRRLIKDIGRTKTVMLSTHIMQEVEALCDRVVIINKGKIVADNSTKNLQREQSRNQVIYVEFDKEISRTKLSGLRGIHTVKHVEGNIYVVESKSEEDMRPVISRFALDNNLLVLTIRKEEQSLEEVFKRLTKKA